MEMNILPNYTFVFKFEENFDSWGTNKSMNDGIYLPYVISLLYVIMVHVGQRVMKDKPAFKLKTSLILWNAGLCVFSVFGAFRIVHALFYVLNDYGFAFSTCLPFEYGYDKVYTCWTYLFTVSKVFELIDTGFIVLRKGNLSFLHWFHHAATLIVTWHGYTEFIALSRWFIGMNFVVHAIMYGYYGFRAAGVKVPRVLAMVITVSQIIQMIIGTIVSVNSLYVLLSGQKCAISLPLSFSFVAIYAFYCYLFLKFFVQNYFSKSKKLSNKVQ